MGLLQHFLQHHFIVIAVGPPYPVALDADLGESRVAEQPQTGLVVGSDVAPQLVCAQRIVCVAAEGLHGVGGVAAPPVALLVDEDADARPALDRVVFEQVDGPDRPRAQQGFDDQPQLPVAEHSDDVLMPFDETLHLVARKRLCRAADRPDVAVVLPHVHQVGILRLHGPQADGFPFDIHSC